MGGVWYQRIGIGFLFLLLGLFAFAVGTPAGTEIRNQASATYIDSAGRPRTTTSNEVVTVVQPVYKFEVKPDGTVEEPGQEQTALAGAPVYFTYTVTNTGNVEDTIDLSVVQPPVQPGTNDFNFEDPKIYNDENCNGQIDPGETEVSSVKLAADASACIVVEARIPDGTEEGKKGHLTLKGKSQGSGDEDTENYARAIATTKAVLTSTKGSSPSGEVKPGDVITYTVEGSNTGGQAACAVTNPKDKDGNTVANASGIFIEDAIPENTTYLPGSLSVSAGAGDAKKAYFDGSSWQIEPSQEPATVTKVGLFIEGSGCFFEQGAQYELSFKVTVNEGVPAGTQIKNVALVQYDTNGDGDAADEGEQTVSNETQNPVKPVYTVKLGPVGDPLAEKDTPTELLDPVEDDLKWIYDRKKDEGGNVVDKDYQIIAKRIRDTNKDGNFDENTDEVITDVYGGETVYFKNTLKNTGNAPDSYNIEISDVPQGWTCQLMAADGVTPLSNPVGEIPAGDTFDFVVKCQIPPTATTEDVTELTVTATSQNDGTASDPTTDAIPPVKPGYDVDIATHGESGDNDPTDDDAPAKPADPGETVQIPFDVTNTGHNPDTFDLTVAGLPENADYNIYPVDCDDPTLPDPKPAPVSDTGLMEAGETKCFVLEATIPEDQPPGTLNTTITAKSSADPDVEDTMKAPIEVQVKEDVVFSPDRSGTVTSPGTIVYDHTLQNNSNVQAFCDIVPGTSQYGWTYQVSTDGNNWSDRLDDVSLAPGESTPVYVRVLVPDGEPINRTEAMEIKALCDVDGDGQADNDYEVTKSVTDTTTVVGGELRLQKEVDKTEAKPGDVLTYTIVATNIGTDDLSKVVIVDPLPAHTEFVSLSATTTVDGAQILYSKDGQNWQTDPVAPETGESIYVGLDSNKDGKITEDDKLPPSESITIVFKVKVQ